MIRDLDLHERVLEELAFDPRVEASDIAVAVSDGIVTLTGTVPSLTQKWGVQEAVKRVRGVRGIADELAVELPGTHVRSDADLVRAIQQRLASNMFVPHNVQVVVHDGHATLSGEVNWHYQLEEAVLEVYRVKGITGLTNLLTVRNEARNTVDDVRRKIHSELQRTADVDANAIDVTVHDDTVILGGSVRTWLERDKAVQAAWSLPGVFHVDNRIAIAP